MRPAFRWAKAPICAFLLATASPVVAQEISLYPAPHCAAFWFGFHDAAKNLAFLEATSADLVRAEGFRTLGHNLFPLRKGEIDEIIDRQRPLMALLVSDVILNADRRSAKTFETLGETCARLAAEHSEIVGLP